MTTTDEKPINDFEILRLLGDHLVETYGEKGEMAKKDLERIATNLRRYNRIVKRIHVARANAIQTSPQLVVVLDSLFKEDDVNG